MLVTREFTFDAAHFLTDYYGKCEKMHGHTYRLQVTLEGAVQKNGLVIDFVILKRVVKKQVLDILDHTVLNEVLENPSTERVVVWIWERLADLPKLLREELEDPNLAAELKRLLKDGEPEVDGARSDLVSSGALAHGAGADVAVGVPKLYEIALWETPSAGVRYRGE